MYDRLNPAATIPCEKTARCDRDRNEDKSRFAARLESALFESSELLRPVPNCKNSQAQYALTQLEPLPMGTGAVRPIAATAAATSGCSHSPQRLSHR